MLLRTLLISLCVTAASVSFSSSASACGVDSNCALGDRHYRIYIPESRQGADSLGAIVYAHGYKGRAERTVANKGLRDLADRLGVALVGVKSADDDWSIPGAPSLGAIEGVDEVAYFDDLRADLIAKHRIEPRRILVTGFSAGAMMIWTLVCHRSQDYGAFVPIAGTFWQPTPKTCDSPPASVIHIHGTADKTVPLAGRKVHDAHQGAVDTVIRMYASFGDFDDTGTDELGGMPCRTRANAASQVLWLCTHPGGHQMKSSFIENAWRRLLGDPQG